ncbi:MAG: tetratricopeptide repeat-containing sensor histidine kinase [Bernardetiaceae bacterium]|nr:tetratricopeptide repeat-containing sensor histidine kinase [Bernardetiaceae bacterium]
MTGCLFAGSALGQNQSNQADSLRGLLTSASPKQRPTIYNQLAELGLKQNPAQAFEDASKALTLANQHDDAPNRLSAQLILGECYLGKGRYWEARSQFNGALITANLLRDPASKGRSQGKLAAAYLLQNRPDEAIENAEQALSFIDSAKQIYDYASITSVLSYAYGRQNRYLRAIEYAQLTLAARLKTKDDNEIGKSYTALGELYGMQNNWAKAWEFFTLARLASENAKNQRGLAISLTNLGIAHLKQGQLKEANKALSQGLKLKYSLGNQKELANSYLQLGILRSLDHQPDSARAYLEKALQIRQSLRDTFGLASTYTALGNASATIGDFAQARAYYEQSLQLAQQTGSLVRLAESYQGLAEMYRRQQNAPEFLAHYQQYRRFQDSIDRELNSVNLLDIQERMASESQLLARERAAAAERARQREQATQKKINYLLLSILAFALLAALVMGSLYLSRKRAFDQLAKTNAVVEEQNAQLSRSQAELTALNQTKDKLFSIIAHDVRSPLASLSGLLKVAQDPSAQLSPTDFTHLTGEIGQHLESVTRLLENLLAWARQQMELVAFKPEPLDLHLAASEAVSLLNREASNKNIVLEMHIAPAVMVQADRDMVDFIFRNLVGNAIKFTPAQGHVSLAAQPNGTKVKVSVADTGLGISEAVRKELFAPIKTQRTTGTAGEVGTGLGLALCREFVEKHGGTIAARPNAPQGSVFEFTLPLAVKG